MLALRTGLPLSSLRRECVDGHVCTLQYASRPSSCSHFGPFSPQGSHQYRQIAHAQGLNSLQKAVPPSPPCHVVSTLLDASDFNMSSCCAALPDPCSSQSNFLLSPLLSCWPQPDVHTDQQIVAQLHIGAVVSCLVSLKLDIRDWQSCRLWRRPTLVDQSLGIYSWNGWFRVESWERFVGLVLTIIMSSLAFLQFFFPLPLTVR